MEAVLEMSDPFTIRRMVSLDCPIVAEMHKAELTDALLSKLGVRFLEKLYSYLLAEPAFRGLVVEHEARVCGFVCTALDASGLYRSVYRKHAVSLALEVVTAGLRSPVLIWRAVQVIFSKTPNFNGELPRVELLSIAVDASRRARGLGKRLINCTIESVKKEGEHSMFVVVNDKIPANKFYLSCGFTKKGSAIAHGDRMNFYILNV